MSGNKKEEPETNSEIASEVSAGPTMSEIQELHTYAVETLLALQKQQAEIAVQVERQVGLVAGLEMLVSGKVEEMLVQIRESLANSQLQGQKKA